MARFRTSARTVDMLGRQQIAGIPTAISELFKNAHDAYATRVEADYYRPEQLLVLRDDGLGMTPDDIIERWLVLGTDSKVGGGGELDDIASALGLEARIPTGEKGIGRLAIAAIGPQVLLVTRARRSDGLHPTVVSFVNWSLFALPGISLDEIEVPVQQFPDGKLPSADDLSSLVAVVRDNLDRVRDRSDSGAIGKIERQLDQVAFDVADLQSRFESAALSGSTSGTQFYIQPTDSMLAAALDAEPEKRRIGNLQKTLMGFANTMMPDRPQAPITTAFRDHRSLDLADSVIGPEAFFTPDEFSGADHHIHGSFDEYGQFSGTVSVYGGEPEQHGIVWPAARGHKTACGPFTIDFAYVQGSARESRVPRDRWNELTAKLDRMGGLYIYRNGIRILPYGNTDYDFLNIEERRNLGAGYYFFSYRRMFGAIELPSDSSRRLVEKAGREGFRENRAYRDFRAILENFLVQLAADYFRDEAVRGTQYRQTKVELDRQARARERQAQQSREKRRALESALRERGAMITGDEPTLRVEAAIEKLVAEVEAASHEVDSDSKLRAILQAELAAQRELAALRSELRIPQPRGFALSRALRGNLAAYWEEHAALDEEVFKPAIALADEVVAKATHGLDVSRRRRFDAAAEEAWRTARQTVAARGRSSEEQLRATSELVSGAVRQTIVDLESRLNEIAQRVQRTDLAAVTDAEVVELRFEFDSEIDSVASAKEEQLEAIAEQLRAITVAPDDSGQIVTQLDIVGAVEEELLALQERAEADLDLTQLGMAVGIIDHEFQATIRSVRSNLRRFRAWADVNEELSDVYNGIRVSFEHLDSYLTLFTPLQRRLYRSEIEIKGSDVSKFLLDLFGERLERHDMEAKATQAFQRHRFTGYPSTFYPVFVNLVDNAIFWLRDQSPPRTIAFDVEDTTMIVADNGPGVHLRDREPIFELGFTRKPGGRGLGLYISRDVLARVGYDLIVGQPADGVGAVFMIRPRNADQNE